ncbi:unnamed protein product [Cochlearia groenlandica]
MDSFSGNKPSSSDPPPPPTSSRIYVGTKAKEILATNDLTEITKLVTSLCFGKETDQSSKLLYKRFVAHFPNILALKLIEAYRHGSFLSPKIRSFTLSLLDKLLTELEDSRAGLKIECVGEDMKNNLNQCLLLQETSSVQDFEILASVVSRVSVDFFINDIPWDELCAYILSLINEEEEQHKKALFLLFSVLPTVLDEGFLSPLLENGLASKILEGLLLRNQEQDQEEEEEEEEEWCLALEAGFNLALQLANHERKDLAVDMVHAIVSSVFDMVNVKRREMVVRKGMVRLAKKVRREAFRFRKDEYALVTRLVSMVKRLDGVGEVTKTASEVVLEVLDKYYVKFEF